MMTNDEFRTWCDTIAPSKRGNARPIARLLGLDRDTVQALQTGKTRKGHDAPVPRTVELACAAIDLHAIYAAHDFDLFPADVQADLDALRGD